MLYPEYRKWYAQRYRGGDGILIGSDSTQEWLLPWWHQNYIRHNSHPITWIDFGLTPEMHAWCKKRGNVIVIRIADIFVAPQEELSADCYSLWEERFGKAFWSCRDVWFKKPAAFLQTPYERTIWIDADCEIKGSIAPLFDLCNPPIPFAMRSTPHRSPAGDLIYNSGVVPYRWGLLLMEKWVEMAFESNNSFMGDQDILSQIIADDKIPIREIPDTYHRFRNEPEEGAILIHWTGANGKKVIEHRWIKERLESSFQAK